MVGKEKESDAEKFVKELNEYEELEALLKDFWDSWSYSEERYKIKKTLENQNKLKELLENLKNKKPIIPIIFGEEIPDGDEAAVRTVLADGLKIESDTPNELVEIAFLLAGDNKWSVKSRIAGNTNIIPDVFAKLAEKLKNEEDWRVASKLLSNPNTPKEIVNEIKEKHKTFLEAYERYEAYKKFRSMLFEAFLRVNKN